MLLHVSAVVVILGCIFQAYIFFRTKRLLNAMAGTPSASHNRPSVPCKTKTCLMCRNGVCVAAQICTYHNAPHTAHVG